MPNARCFVVAPIGEPESSTRKRTKQVFEHIVMKAVEGKYDGVLAHRLSKPGRITMQIIEELVNAPLLIADLTDNNANVYYELSLRHAVNLPAVLLIQEDQREHIPFDLKDLRIVPYDLTDPDKIEKSIAELSEQIEEVERAENHAVIPEDLILVQIPNEPSANRIFLSILFVANMVRFELIEPFLQPEFQPFGSAEERHYRLRAAFSKVMRFSAQHGYLRQPNVEQVFEGKLKKKVADLYEDAAAIVQDLGPAITRNDESEIRRHLEAWRQNNTEFFRIVMEQYDEWLSENLGYKRTSARRSSVVKAG